MNLLKQLWNWLVKKTSTAPELAVVEEEEPVESVSEIFVRVCADHGIGLTLLEKHNAIELFVEWFDGDQTYDCILGCMRRFMQDHPIINAKFMRFFK